MKKLSEADITTGIDGGKWIRIKRTKTKTPSSIPLLPVAEEIINRYQDHPEVKAGISILPVLSNQKSNAFLKRDRFDVWNYKTTYYTLGAAYFRHYYHPYQWGSYRICKQNAGS